MKKIYFNKNFWENFTVKKKTEIVITITESEKTIRPFSLTEKTPNLLHKKIIGPTKQNKTEVRSLRLVY